MRIRERPALVLGLLAGIAAPGAACAVPIAIEGSLNFPTVGCVVDGIPLRCQLDTGDDATATVVASPLTAHLPLIASRNTMGAAGVVVPTDEVKVEEIHVGNIHVTQPTRVFRTARSEPISVLGRGFFQAMQTVTFDFRGMTLTGDEPAGAICPGVFHVGALLEVPAEFDGQAIRAGWDTGAGFTFVDTTFIARHPDLFKYVKDMPAIDATERATPSKIYTTSAFAICGHKIDGMQVATLDLSAAKAQKPDMPDVVFGDDLLMGHVWSFDFRDGRWSIN